jgi:hypothetical protein
VIRLGRWEDVLADVECDSVITDPPYGERTHSNVISEEDLPDGCERATIDYTHWGASDVERFVDAWAGRTRRWIVALTSHDLVDHWLSSYRANDFYAFAPVGVVVTGMGVRIQGDGPASWTLWICAGRRKARKLSTARGAKGIWRSLPGGYTGPSTENMAGGRGKPPWLCEALVRDYSDPGMLVCDPCAGWGHTLLAARDLGRRFIGAEMDPAAHAVADRMLRGDGRANPRPEQPSLFGGAA